MLRSSEEGAMSWRTGVLVSLVLVLGCMASIIASFVARDGRDRATQRETALAATETADALVSALESAFEISEAVTTFPAQDWPTAEEYDLAWSLASDLPGSSAVVLIVAVQPRDLDDFLAAVNGSGSTMEISFLNSSPPEVGHLLTLQGAPADVKPFLGSDLSAFGPIAARLASVPPGSSLTLGEDFRLPALPFASGQLQRTIAHNSVGPMGEVRRAWSIVQLDINAIADQAIDLPPDAYGLQVTANINPELVQRDLVGDERATVTIERSVGDIELTIEVSTNGTLTTAASPTNVLLWGLSITALLALLVGAVRLIQALAQRLDRSEHQARRDQLTGLPNRRWLLEHLDDMSIEPGTGVALLFCDLDRFKVVNDSVGHTVGDEFLQQVAQRYAEAAEPHPVVRFGGDEFIIVCMTGPGEDPVAAGTTVAQRLIDEMGTPFDLGGTLFSTTVSVGLAVSEADRPLDGGELIRSADAALARRKRSGRNGLVVYDEAFRTADLDRLELEQALQASLDRDELVVHYQPLVNEAGRVVSFEALVRWERDGVLVPPGDFLPLVRELGRMNDLGRIVLEQAVPQFCQWLASGRYGDDLTLHVNIDPVQVANCRFPRDVAALIERCDLDPARLVLEVTEHEWLEAADETADVVRMLGEVGVGLAIDDFGSGHSSMGRILDLDGLTEIKLDRSIVQRIVEQQASRAFVAGFVQIAAGLEVALVAEGVETIEEHRLLQTAGVRLFQGYLFGRPVPADLVGAPAASPLGASGTNDPTPRYQPSPAADADAGSS